MRVKKMITYCIILLIKSNPKKKITPCVKKRDPVCVGFFFGGGVKLSLNRKKLNNDTSYLFLKRLLRNNKI